MDCHTSEGASIKTVCHSQIKRKLVEALDISSTSTRGHAGYWMSVGEHAYCSWKAGSGLRHRKSSFSTHPKEESKREQEPEPKQLAGEPEVQFLSWECWTCIREAMDSKHLAEGVVSSQR